jgi:O-antigen ligase
VACLTCVFGISFGAAANFILEIFSKLLVQSLLLLVAIRRTADLRRFVWAFVISGGLVAWMALFLFDLHSTHEGSGIARLSNLYTYDANDAAALLVVTLPLACLTMRTARGWMGRIFSFLVVAGIAGAVARSGSRGGFLGLLVVGLALLVLSGGVSLWRRMLVVGVFASVLWVKAPPGYWKQMNTIIHPDDDYNIQSVDGRKQVWIRGMGYLAQYPFFGVGIGNFSRAEGTISEKARNYSGGPLKWIAPHNSFLQAGVEMGVIGFLLWTSLIVGSAVQGLRLRRRLVSSIGEPKDRDGRFLLLSSTYLPLALIGFMVTGFFLSHAYMDYLFVLIALASGFGVCARAHQAERAAGEAAERSQPTGISS